MIPDYLTHYYQRRPFQSLTRLTAAERQAVVATLNFRPGVMRRLQSHKSGAMNACAPGPPSTDDSTGGRDSDFIDSIVEKSASAGVIEAKADAGTQPRGG